jgi:hypothetical protein
MYLVVVPTMVLLRGEECSRLNWAALWWGDQYDYITTTTVSEHSEPWPVTQQVQRACVQMFCTALQITMCDAHAGQLPDPLQLHVVQSPPEKHPDQATRNGAFSPS